MYSNIILADCSGNNLFMMIRRISFCVGSLLILRCQKCRIILRGDKSWGQKQKQKQPSSVGQTETSTCDPEKKLGEPSNPTLIGWREASSSQLWESDSWSRPLSCVVTHMDSVGVRERPPRTHNAPKVLLF